MAKLDLWIVHPRKLGALIKILDAKLITRNEARRLLDQLILEGIYEKKSSLTLDK